MLNLAINRIMNKIDIYIYTDDDDLKISLLYPEVSHSHYEQEHGINRLNEWE